MWKVLQEVIPILLVILLLSQYVVPILFNGTKWWLFKRSNKEEAPKVDPSTLSEELKATKTIVDEAKAKVEIVKGKVEGNLKSAEDLKNEADKLL